MTEITIYQDKTKEAVPNKGWWGAFFGFLFLVLLFAFILFFGLKAQILSGFTRIGEMIFLFAFTPPFFFWAISNYIWILLYFPCRVDYLRRRQGGSSIIVRRGQTLAEFEVPTGSLVRYDISFGNIRADLNQRGNAPFCFNIWFDFNGILFFVPTASKNFRDALKILSDSVNLKYDPTLREYERTFYFYRWKQTKNRDDFAGFLEEIHIMLKKARRHYCK